MLSDEEKKAIKELTEIKELFEEDLKENYEVTAILDKIDLESLVIVLNLIEKQSKKIEELKDITETLRKENVSLYIERRQNETKIKAKIEEYDDKGMTVNLTNRSAGKTFQQAVHYEVRKVLQSLLEKE